MSTPPNSPRRRRRPGLRTLLVGVALVLTLLPLLLLTMLRIPESELIRRTESELVAQGAVIAAAYRVALGQAVDDGQIHPISTDLDLAEETLHPPAGPAPVSKHAASDAALDAGARIAPIIGLAQRTTLAAIRVVDENGTIVASTAGEVGRSLRHQQEVVRALEGRPTSLLRQRHSSGGAPDFDSPSRGTGHRVFLAIPIRNQGKVLGAVSLSRTPLSLSKAAYQHGRNLLTGVALAVALAIGVILLAGLVIIRPIKAVIAQTQAIARGDDGALQPIDRPGTAEIESLSMAFAQMARTLRDRGDYLKTFASNVSHAFKTPLTSIRGSIELLGDHLGEMSPEERERFLLIVARDTERLERLVQRLMELGRADVTSPGGESAHVPPILERLAARYRAEGSAVSVEHDPAVDHVPLAPETLESVLCNLLDNAREHGGPQVVTTVTTRREDGWTSITVSDDGPGIEPERREKVFEPFHTTAKTRGGTGLGLAIVRTLVTAHGGRLELLESERGAAFRIVI